MNNDTIGVDVSKDHLDADRLADGASRRFANDQCGRKAFVKWFAQTPVQRVVFEPTGPYHRAFERALGAAGVPFVKVNPRQARRFAEAIGKLAKTDRLDAAMLARMGAMLELRTRPPQSEALLELKELHLARQALVKDRTAAKNRGKVLAAPLLKRHNAQRLEQIKRQITAIEAAILEQVQADPDLAQRFAILTSIPGVSAITARFRLSSSKCPNSAPLNRGRRQVSQAKSRRPSLASQVSQALRLWRDSRVAGPVAPSSAAAEPTSARPSPCPRWSRPDSIPT
jgi:transposase